MPRPIGTAGAWFNAGLKALALAVFALFLGVALGGMNMDEPAFGDYRFIYIAGIGTPIFGAVAICCMVVALAISLLQRDDGP